MLWLNRSEISSECWKYNKNKVAVQCCPRTKDPKVIHFEMTTFVWILKKATKLKKKEHQLP